jgi:hypothetical protein
MYVCCSLGKLGKGLIEKELQGKAKGCQHGGDMGRELVVEGIANYDVIARYSAHHNLMVPHSLRLV